MKLYSFKNIESYKLIFGTAIAQAIPFLFSPILSRLYSPSDYALLGVMLALSNVLVEFTNFKYERSIVLEEDLLVSKNILFTCVLLSVFVGLILLIIGSVFNEQITSLKIHSQFHQLIFFIPFMITSMGIVVASNFWFQRKNEFSRLTSNKIVQMLGITLISLLFGFIKIKNGLSYAYILGWIIVLFFSFFQLRKTQVSFSDFNLNEIKKGLKKYSYFPKFSLLPSVFHILALSLPYFMVPIFFGEEAGGQFNMCKQMLIIPLSFISSGFTQIYFRKFAENFSNKSHLLPLLYSMFRPLLMVAAIAFPMFYFFGELIFTSILGMQWKAAGEFSQYYIFAAILQYFSISIMIILPVINKVKQEGVFKLSYFLVIFLLFFIDFKSQKQFLIFYTIVESIIFSVIILYSLYEIKKFDNKV